jgi:hypothetical protein
MFFEFEGRILIVAPEVRTSVVLALLMGWLAFKTRTKTGFDLHWRSDHTFHPECTR